MSTEDLDVMTNRMLFRWIVLPMTGVAAICLSVVIILGFMVK